MAKRKELSLIIEDGEGIKAAVSWFVDLARRGLVSGPVMLIVTRPRRTKDQNAKLWPMLADISAQVDWHGQKLSAQDWKHVFTASLQKQKAVPGIDGGFVVLGVSTSSMTKKLFCDLVELIYAFGAEQGVSWSEPEKPAEELWRED